jgi:hypothetical protein
VQARLAAQMLSSRVLAYARTPSGEAEFPTVLECNKPVVGLFLLGAANIA